MPSSSAFPSNSNWNSYGRKPPKTTFVDESIYYKREMPGEKAVPIQSQPIIQETIFLPDYSATTPRAVSRDLYPITSESYSPVYSTTAETKGSFDPFRALGLKADCPCWSWICIIVGLILLLGLMAICLYFIFARQGRI